MSTLFLFHFVAAEIFLGFGEDNVFAENGVVFLEAEFVRSVHGVFLRVICTNARFLGNETNEFALGVILFCHINPILAQIMKCVKWSRLSDLDRRPAAYKAIALPAELSRHENIIDYFNVFWKRDFGF